LALPTSAQGATLRSLARGALLAAQVLTLSSSSAHADFDVLTLLFQREGQDGLEVCPGKDITTEFGKGDVWTPIKVERGAIVVNVGDQLKRWSDDRLQSCVFFHGPSPHCTRG